eukprot:CAMPEP_0204354712 /NCGR_PEP_ID=MMETSP0469-20131031/33603_1 /ASSEMBLY_ACC=CAM_ASM_000384 /TAXON_ID=2969 /ORGANISM="Oxyrrhis marina" /LENGTH=101 /DNA_ID=CAMNT_0051341845 /DNA_START=622 /DNA_END=923 /DNA_ORIENTATION=+
MGNEVDTSVSAACAQTHRQPLFSLLAELPGELGHPSPHDNRFPGLTAPASASAPSCCRRNDDAVRASEAGTTGLWKLISSSGVAAAAAGPPAAHGRAAAGT